MRQLSLETVKDLFYLDEGSPSGLRWNIDKYSGAHNHIQSIVKGSIAGSKGKDYWVITYDYLSYGVHRLVYMLLNNVDYSTIHFVDHEDGNGHNNAPANLRDSGPKLNSRNKRISSANQSGTVGVFITTTKGKKYARAQWYDLQGKRCTKNFSYSIYGEDGAWAAALDTRNKAMEEMQLQGAGYTNRHLSLDIPQQ